MSLCGSCKLCKHTNIATAQHIHYLNPRQPPTNWVERDIEAFQALFDEDEQKAWPQIEIGIHYYNRAPPPLCAPKKFILSSIGYL